MSWIIEYTERIVITMLEHTIEKLSGQASEKEWQEEWGELQEIRVELEVSVSAPEEKN